MFLEIIRASTSFTISSTVDLSPLPVKNSKLLITLSTVCLLPSSAINTAKTAADGNSVPPS